MKWESKHIDLGVVRTNKKVTINFYANEYLDIVNMTVSCGCTKPKYISEERRLEVIYNPGSVPIHLRHTEKFSTNKSITVWYGNGTKDVLSFSALIVSK